MWEDALKAAIRRIDPATLARWLTDGGELALLDAREDGEFGAAHPFWGVPFSLSKREMRAGALLPRLAVRIVCIDDGSGLAETLAGWLDGIGATDVSVLDGGTKAWAEAGYVLFSGMNVPSKAFGEWVEHHYGTVSVDPHQLADWQASGRRMVVLDSRTHEEFVRMTIPGAISVPGGELAYRIGDLAPDPETLVVVNCAGRTRSILGAESLRRAGIPNEVVALRNGTMGWELAGLRCANGRTDRYPAGTPQSVPLALERAARFADASGVRVIDEAALADMQADTGRTLYLLDVRDPSEFAAAHRPGSRNAPGGQLVQATDAWIGVRGARVVLLDDTGVRARMTGAWLRQMGHRDVFVLPGGDMRAPQPEPPIADGADAVRQISVLGLQNLLDTGDRTVIVDLARSLDFREGHIPGAVWAIRTRLHVLADTLGAADHVVLTSPDGAMARLAAAEAASLSKAEVRVLEGGTAAWHEFGRPLVKDRTNPPDAACVDVYLRPYDRNEGVEEAMHAYLSWEIALVDEIARDGTVRFGVHEAVG
jgi:rhodanese-related sulfurtransferase